MFFRREPRKGTEVKRSPLWKDTGVLKYAKANGDFDCRRSKVCKSLRKKSLRLVIGFLTGHYTLKGHLHKSWGCRWCILQIRSSWRGIFKTPANKLRCDYSHASKKLLLVSDSFKDAPKLNHLYFLDFLKRFALLDWDWVSSVREKWTQSRSQCISNPNEIKYNKFIDVSKDFSSNKEVLGYSW